jgi:hypothetical protein
VHAILTPFGVDRRNLAAVTASAGNQRRYAEAAP